MTRYIFWRLLTAVPTLVVVVTLTFFMMRVAPGGPFDQERALDPVIRANLERAYHLDLPLVQQYAIYLGNLANNAIGVIGTDRKYRQLAQCPRLSWVDSLSFGPDGLYAVVNRLHRSATLNGGDAQSKPPYFLLKVKALAAGLPGR